MRTPSRNLAELDQADGGIAFAHVDAPDQQLLESRSGHSLMIAAGMSAIAGGLGRELVEIDRDECDLKENVA